VAKLTSVPAEAFGRALLKNRMETKACQQSTSFPNAHPLASCVRQHQGLQHLEDHYSGCSLDYLYAVCLSPNTCSR
uniref:Uncharacterized protein n=1 Tax=Oreochromis niloticus TaxID=8128 RepID=A0A669BNX0_ORENI